MQPPLADCLQPLQGRDVAASFAVPADPASLATCNLTPWDMSVLNPEAVLAATTEGVRRLQVCPNMRARGSCRLPSCPYIHEVCVMNKKYRGHKPLYNSHLTKDSKAVPCRFYMVQGTCPHGDSCLFSHATADRGAGPKTAEAEEPAEGGSPRKATASNGEQPAPRPAKVVPTALELAMGTPRASGTAQRQRPLSAGRPGRARPGSACASSKTVSSAHRQQAAVGLPRKAR